ncbi:conserved hypothetical protein [Leishmania major strain Friedlin]|uniref:ADP-ribosylation factor-like protein n=1 Tax=Leishmania major TaxID=5664 RepID=Q4Q8X3_LEIMA|nr:conserved hypothetical protein [Leishmania major strain Friedlin]CAG9576544.1 ADP-ribosylation_factor_family_-_putative [Leishmania major strain Friedlin]CAJ05542.1 conserved hypothetical protein [Leishmania major strain Friedlin]|eukprot:XP_001684225.1 conserved hypothetical protein [Leishmania major strain Friedlin]
MLHFLTGVYNSLFSTPEYNVLIVGRECAGKSTLLEQLKFLYTPAVQQQQQASLLADRSSSSAGEKTITATTNIVTEAPTTPPQQRRPRAHPLPPGTPLPATATQLAQKRIRPTVGLNYAVVQHRFSPPVSAVTLVKKSQLPLQAVASLPSLPQDLLYEQRARQQEVMANAPSDAVTRVVLRDLGGQAALRDLWEKYYPRSQGIVYVIDSTLPFRMPSASPSSPPSATEKPPRDHFTKQELTEAYKQDRDLLARLLQHPLLHGVPVLILSNKTDEVTHIPLTILQEALQLAELAADPTFYLLQNSSDGNKASEELESQQRLHDKGSDGSGPSQLPGAAASPIGAPLSRRCTSAEEVQLRVGGSGFGEVSMRVVEVSALDGVGVAGAMDWLMAQLLRHARDVDSSA